MILIFRWWYFLGVGGLGCAGYGAMELRHALANASEPVEISLAALEAGEPPAQTFVRLVEYCAVYPMIAYRQSRSGRIETSCYPIVSTSHEFVAGWRELTRQRAQLGLTTGEVPLLLGRDVKVYVFDERWQRTDQLPSAPAMGQSLEGILRPIGELGAKQRSVLATTARQELPETTYVLDADRRPRSVATCVQFLAVGVVLLVLAVVRFFRKPPVVAAG